MNLNRFCNSLITRLVLFGTTVVLLSAAIRYYVIIDFLRQEQIAVVAEQQSVIASYLAHDINHRILERRHYLEQLAATLPIGLLGKPEQLQGWLAERQILQPIFSRGLYITDASGKVIVDYPVNNRVGRELGIYPGVQRAQSGVVVVGEPMLGHISEQPVLPMLAPVRSADGRLVAVLGGTSAINDAGFLDQLQIAELTDSSSVIVVSPNKRRIIAANDPRLDFQELPPVGADPQLDKAIDGYRGNSIGPGINGEDEIKAVAAIPSTDWFVMVRLPVSSGLPTLTQVTALILRGTLIQALVIFLFIILSVLWFFRPLQRTADLADKMTRGELPLAPLPIVHEDEVGHLTLAFNRLLASLKMHQAELQHQAHHDLLTGLPNRVMLAERMQKALTEARRDNTGVALLFLDLDGFKPINDTHGHKHGDLVLQEITQRLLHVARHSDTLARVGGDEFVLLAADLGMPLEMGARALAEKCIQAVGESMRVGDIDCQIGVSIGIALSDGDCDAEHLLQAADKAMYEAKSRGRGCYIITPSTI